MVPPGPGYRPLMAREAENGDRHQVVAVRNASQLAGLSAVLVPSPIGPRGRDMPMRHVARARPRSLRTSAGTSRLVPSPRHSATTRAKAHDKHPLRRRNAEAGRRGSSPGRRGRAASRSIVNSNPRSPSASFGGGKGEENARRERAGGWAHEEK